MDFEEINKRIEKSLIELKCKDEYLLEKDLSERCIAFRFGMYIAKAFTDYDVDCEYNGFHYDEDKSKFIRILKSTLTELKRARENEKDIDENEFLERNVFPDIIIHQRGRHTNLLAIEIKKSTIKNTLDFKFDKKKVRCYTSTSGGNALSYNYGLFLVIPTGKDYFGKGKPKYYWFENGTEKADNDTDAKSTATNI